MIITTHILAMPLVVLLWTIDAYVFLLTARLVLQHIPAGWARRAGATLAPLTNGILDRAHRCAGRIWPRLPFSGAGLFVLIGCLVVRQILVHLLRGAA